MPSPTCQSLPRMPILRMIRFRICLPRHHYLPLRLPLPLAVAHALPQFCPPQQVARICPRATRTTPRRCRAPQFGHLGKCVKKRIFAFFNTFHEQNLIRLTQKMESMSDQQTGASRQETPRSDDLRKFHQKCQKIGKFGPCRRSTGPHGCPPPTTGHPTGTARTSGTPHGPTLHGPFGLRTNLRPEKRENNVTPAEELNQSGLTCQIGHSRAGKINGRMVELNPRLLRHINPSQSCLTCYLTN